MDTNFYWPPSLNNGQLYAYNNIFACLYLCTLLLSIAAAFAPARIRNKYWPFLLTSFTAVHVRTWVSQIIPDPTDSFQFLLFFTVDWILFWIYHFLIKRLDQLDLKKRIPESTRFLVNTGLCTGIAGQAAYRLFGNHTLDVLIMMGIITGAAIMRQARFKQAKPHWTYVDLLEKTGTRRPTKPRTYAYVIVMYFVSLYLSWRFLFTLPFQSHSTLAMVLAIILFVTECMAIMEFLYHCKTISQDFHFRLPEASLEDEWPDIDVFIATYNEDADLLFKTINGCRHMQYPDPDKVHIYLCDDGRREEIRQLAEETHIGYVTRDNNEGAKAGNLNNALKLTNSPLVVTFDADMIPRARFLMETIPYFIDARKRNQQLLKSGQPPIPLGFIQTPQAFYNQDLFQFHLYSENSLANEQDYFYREIQPSRTLSNSVIYGGSNTVLSRAALESVGGFFTKAITEDFATGILIEGNGYVSLGTSYPLAYGLSAEDFPSLIQQRKRWGRGVINVLYQINLFFTCKYSNAQKMSYWSSIQYWFSPFTRAVFSLTPILSALFGIAVVNCSIQESLTFWLPYMLAQTFMLNHLTHNLRSSFWTIVYDTILAPFLFFPILNELFGISLKTFKVTKKGGTDQKHNQPRYIWPFAISLVLTGTATIAALWQMASSHQFGMVITLFWLINNLFVNLIALLFVADTKPGSPELMNRDYLSVTVSPETSAQIIRDGAVLHLSEDHMSIVFHRPWNIDAGTRVCVNLTYQDKTIPVLGTVDGMYHKNGMPVVELFRLQSPNREEFLTMVYDRDLVPYEGTTGPVIFVALVRILNNRFRKRQETKKQARELERSQKRAQARRKKTSK
ncbi:glycosyltransferase [Allobaculum sp. JKK-2023]|uniref:glycosyltransferase n=1 Tax=Allobaculum sp. JKK-2023 TaxID=3108943 RepID=UPI002B05E399|nr:glycosyltransferase [Allobaculum sp. JKK-2023]